MASSRKPQDSATATAGYSGTQLPKKLGIKDGHRIALLGAPDNYDQTLGQLPDGVTVQTSLRGRAAFDVIQLFTVKATELERRFVALSERLEPAGGLWISWPKKSSGVTTDVTDAVVRKIGLASGLVDNKVCAVDETWSGLRFVIRIKNR